MQHKEVFFNFFNSGRKSAIIVPILLGLLFGLAARFNETGGQFKPYDIMFLIEWCFYSLMFIVAFFAIEKGLTRLTKKRNEKGNADKKNEVLPDFIAPTWSGMKKYVCITTLCWIPTYLFLFPGIMVGDTAMQIEEYIAGGTISDWHPFLDTIVYGKFFELGGISNPMLGIGVFVALQMVFAIFVISYVVYYVKTLMQVRHSSTVALLFLVVYPMAVVTFMTVNKDTSFTPFFMLFSLLYCEIWRTRGKLLKKPSFLIVFIFVCLLTMYTKKTGPYLVSVALMLMVFMKGKRAFRSFAFLGGVALLLFSQVFVPAVIFPQINVTSGPKQEMLAIPEQQLARIVKDSPEEFSEQERQIIDDVIAVGFDGIAENYNNYLVDPIKKTYIPKEDSVGAFLQLWFKKGLQHPWEYIATEIGLESVWFSFSGSSVGSMHVYISYTDSESANDLSNVITWPEASWASKVWSALYTRLVNTPVLNAVMYVCIWASIVPFCLLFLIWRRAKHPLDALVAQSPLLLSMAMLMLCPTSTHARYMLPMMLAAPIFIAVLTNTETRKIPKST